MNTIEDIKKTIKQSINDARFTETIELRKECDEKQKEINALRQELKIQDDANDILTKQLDAARAEADALRTLANEHRHALICGHLHHGKKERHEWNEPCPVEARIDAALSREGK